MLDASARGGVGSVRRFDKTYCKGTSRGSYFKVRTYLINSPRLMPLILRLEAAVDDDLLSIITALRRSPLVSEYICQYHPSSGFNWVFELIFIGIFIRILSGKRTSHLSHLNDATR